MNREETIARIKDHIEIHKLYEKNAVKITEALEMAIKALVQEPCEDCVSRKAAIDAMTDKNITCNMDSVQDSELHRIKRAVHRILASLPSAQPERKKGKWIVRETACEDVEARCSCCGFSTLVNEPGNGLHMIDDLNFCSNCGADMRGEEDGSN